MEVARDLLSPECAVNSCKNLGFWVKHTTLQWRHNERHGVSNHQPHHCLRNRLFRRRSKKTSKLRVTGLCAGKSPVTGEFPAQRASYVENVSIWWRHHEIPWRLNKMIDILQTLLAYVIYQNIYIHIDMSLMFVLRSPIFSKSVLFQIILSSMLQAIVWTKCDWVQRHASPEICISRVFLGEWTD